MGEIFDIIIIVTLLLFTLRGIKNGLIGEIAGIFSLVAGFWAASAWNEALAPHLGFIADPSWRVIVACAVIFFGVMLGIAIIAHILKKIVSYSFIGWIDKLGGLLLGLAKGVIVWGVIIIALSYLVQDAAFMRESRTVPYFSSLLTQIQKWLPPDMLNNIRIQTKARQ